MQNVQTCQNRKIHYIFCKYGEQKCLEEASKIITNSLYAVGSAQTSFGPNPPPNTYKGSRNARFEFLSLWRRSVILCNVNCYKLYFFFTSHEWLNVVRAKENNTIRTHNSTLSIGLYTWDVHSKSASHFPRLRVQQESVCLPAWPRVPRPYSWAFRLQASQAACIY